MRSLPPDLVPLPTMPYSERPSSMPLDVEECRTALWRCSGNITNAAALLKVSSIRLRNFVKNSPRLSAELAESREQLADMAEDVVVEALSDDTDAGRRDSMAKFVLSSQGRARGYGSGSSGLTINAPKGPITISWADGSVLTGPTPANGDDAKVIEGEAVNG